LGESRGNTSVGYLFSSTTIPRRFFLAFDQALLWPQAAFYILAIQTTSTPQRLLDLTAYNIIYRLVFLQQTSKSSREIISTAS